VWDNRNRDEKKRSTRSFVIWIVIIIVLLLGWLYRASIVDLLGRL